MSNSFDLTDNLGVAVTATPLIRLLQAIANEWTRIAEDLNELGGAISSRAVSETGPANAVDLQAFDTIHQRAQGQATLLAKLVRKIADDHSFDRKRLNELLEDIPFHSVRSSLSGAFDGHPDPDRDGDESDDIDWL